MVAGKRVPAAYRKGNRRSHLTGDTVYRTGAILVPSGKKLTVGQQRRRRQRQQRGGTGKSWADEVHHSSAKAYLRGYGGNDTVAAEDRADEMERVASNFAGNYKEQAEHFIAWHDKVHTTMRDAQKDKIRAVAAAQDMVPQPEPQVADEPPGSPPPQEAPEPPTPPPALDTKEAARLQLLQETPAVKSFKHLEPGTGPGWQLAADAADVVEVIDAYASTAGQHALTVAITDPNWWAAHVDQAIDFAKTFGKEWSELLPVYLYRLLTLNSQHDQMTTAAERLINAMTPVAATKISSGDGTLIQDQVEHFLRQHAPLPEHTEPVAGLGPSEPPPAGAPMTPRSQPAASPAGSHYSIPMHPSLSVAPDPATTDALNRLSGSLDKLEQTQRDVAATDIPEVADVIATNPEIANLVSRGMVNPRQLSNRRYVSDLREQLQQWRESGLKDAEGKPLYSTATSRPNTLHRGRIARSAVPVFEREGKPSARSGLRYYRRAQASRVPIFSTA